ncbi:MAG: bifunctional phosphopantothenoylcysteine decarboxylase/phosphopantothenate--cysteine ligase CoaBC [Solirubrobacteraceae bacterium]|nr:MAG: bifunctional phosphopantothenoylcysteine decarboxylase/phosphopantothenate--cysteine ligase CoaBC [Solirubrobacterales bacterium]
MARLLLGVSGGIAAYKALELVRLATAAGHAVRVIETEAATRFVGKASFAALTGAPTLTSAWERDPARGAFPGDAAPNHDPLSHLELVGRADCMLIAPASANTIAKLAHGLADNLLTEAALAARCPLLIAPAMNNRMFEHPATTANLALLRERGVTVVDPGEGRLGSLGEWGAGRLAEPPALLEAIERLLGGDAFPGYGPLDGLRVLVSAGGTREAIDAVRYIGNRSSGRMGFAIADEAAARGAHVEVVAANVELPRSPGIGYQAVESAAELAAACRARFAECDVLVMCAAVVDFRPTLEAEGKLKKGAAQSLELRLERTEDVLRGLADRRAPGQTLVAFAAEHGDGSLARGRAKLRDKGVDLLVVNDIAKQGIGFDAQDNEVWLLSGEDETHVAQAPKRVIAGFILDAVATLRAAQPARR